MFLTPPVTCGKNLSARKLHGGSCNNDFLVRRNNQDLGRSVTDHASVRLIGRLVYRYAQPAHAITDTPADVGRIFTNPAAEDQPVQTAKHRSHRAQFAAVAEGEVVQRLSLTRDVRGLRLAHRGC